MIDTAVASHSTTTDIQALKGLGDRVHILQATLPLNPDELPLSYIDPQVLAAKGFLQDVSHVEDLDGAVVKLDFLDGFPTINDLPFWERLDGELISYYEYFKAYRDMIKTGRRSMVVIAERGDVNVKLLVAISRMYHWTHRVKAYDQYKLIEREAERDARMIEMEGRHSSVAKKIFESCSKWMDDDELMEAMTPKEQLSWFETALKLERLSLGLAPDKPFNSSDQTNINTVIQNIQSDNKTIQIDANAKDLQGVMDVLAATGQLAKLSGGNGGKNNSSGDEQGRTICVEQSPDSEAD